MNKIFFIYLFSALWRLWIPNLCHSLAYNLISINHLFSANSDEWLIFFCDWLMDWGCSIVTIHPVYPGNKVKMLCKCMVYGFWSPWCACHTECAWEIYHTTVSAQSIQARALNGAQLNRTKKRAEHAPAHTHTMPLNVILLMFIVNF